MSGAQGAILTDRGVVRVGGGEAETFLQGLVTADVAGLKPGTASLAALLTPQGKILFDFLLFRGDDDFRLDCRADQAAELARRLTFYKLRAKVEIEDRSNEEAVIAFWNGPPAALPALSFADPRHASLGSRAVVAKAEAGAARRNAGAEARDLSAYHAHRIALAIPEGGLDFAYGETFPHEADMDRLGGVSFTKGCYVGQEVVSRMEHRGTARTRILPVEFSDRPGAPGSDVRAGDRSLGTLGSTAGKRGLAMVRLDRAAAAIAAGEEIVADGAALRLHEPEWTEFGLATAAASDGAAQ